MSESSDLETFTAAVREFDIRTWLPQWQYAAKTYQVQRVDERWTVE